MTAKRPSRATLARLRLQTYHLIDEAVEHGVTLGYNRAHKHTNAPTRETMEEVISRSVMELLAELIDWERSG